MNVRPQPGPRGSALVLVLWIVACAMVMAMGLNRRMRLELAAVRNDLASTQARWLARGALVRGIAAVEADAKFDTGLYKADAYKESWYHHPDLLKEGWLADLPGIRLKGEKVDYAVSDESAKLNLNAAPKDVLKKLPGLERDWLLAILRRRAGKDRVLGTKDDGLFRSLGEVLTLEEADPRSWRGTWMDGELEDGWGRLVTVYGDDRINVNTASAEVLSCIPLLGRRAAEAIVACREGPDGRAGTSDDVVFRTLSGLRGVKGLSQTKLRALRPYVKFTSRYFTVRGTATQHGGRVAAHCWATVMRAGDRVRVVCYGEGSLGG